MTARILVADDDEPIGELVATILEEAGHTVERAYDGRQAIDRLDRGNAWAGLRAIGLVERERGVGATVMIEVRHYLLSGAAGAAAFGHAVRRHWGIENRLHWLLDVAFAEDACRVRAGHAARNLAVVRHLALNLLRQNTTRTGSVATKRFTAALDDAYLSTILAGVARLFRSVN